MDHPPPSPSSSNTSFPILAITILGILTTAIILVSYYIFAIQCCQNWRRNDLFNNLPSTNYRRHFDHFAAKSQGLDPSLVYMIPTKKFTKEANFSSFECAICLNEFQEEERLRILPSCSHSFHTDCIDIWLSNNTNCPICRQDITSPIAFPTNCACTVIEVRNEEGSSNQATIRREVPKLGSLGDECIDVRHKDEEFCVQPIRRSLSLGSSNDRQLYLSVQEILRHKPHLVLEVGGEGSSGGKVRRSFFSFGHGRSSRSAILPINL
ncbi:RING-H2 finger protein ATL16-like [Typha latifolia]|uniref:RING-H2 finger protein ATL16-like n=1 Tax=Typha latifolia TaxID=4733 RepID=UPI003C2F76CF